MKLKIELDLTPEEAQDLFIPSGKQKEFAQELYKAYVNALSRAAGVAMDRTVGRVFKKKAEEQDDA